MNRCSFREWIPILPWPVWPLAGQCLLGQNVVAGSMIVLLAVCGSRPRGVCWAPIFVTSELHHGYVQSYPFAVASQANGKTIYHQVNGTCTCQDFTQEKAPNGFCKHRLAHGLYRRAMELVHVQEPVVEAQPTATAETAQVPVQHTEAPA